MIMVEDGKLWLGSSCVNLIVMGVLFQEASHV